MKDRLKQLRKELHLNQQDFSEKLGINRGTLANYEVGRNEPIDAVIKLICDRFNVNEAWLRTGEGEMFVELSREDELQRLIDESMKEESGEIRRRFATAVMRLTPEQIRRCIEWAKETFNLVDAPAAAPDPEEHEMTIDEKVESYRRELEAEAASEKSQASRPGKEA